MQAICPICFKAVPTDSLTSGSAFHCESCGQSFRIQLSSTILGKDFGDTDIDQGIPSVSQQRLGRFVLLDVLGRGGFGEVFRAFDSDLQRTVAIKIPNSAFVQDKELIERMSREARSAGQLHHEAIVAVLEWGTEGKLPFIVYEFVQGTTLAQLLGKQRFSYRETATESVSKTSFSAHDFLREGIIVCHADRPSDAWQATVIDERDRGDALHWIIRIQKCEHVVSQIEV